MARRGWGRLLACDRGEGTLMRAGLRRIWRDISSGHFVDAYAVAALAVLFAVLSVVGDVVSDNLRWAALLAGVGLLVYRITVPAVSGSVDTVVNDRSGFENTPLSGRLRDAREVWLFAPSGVNFLAMPTLDALRKNVLSRADGSVRIVVLDPNELSAVALAVRQLDASVDFPLQDFGESLKAVVRHLKAVAGWEVAGSFDYRLLDYNPGFSLVAIDPQRRQGTVIVEFHGFHNEFTAGRMHLELRRADSERWYTYWVEQFEHIWTAARPH